VNVRLLLEADGTEEEVSSWLRRLGEVSQVTHVPGTDSPESQWTLSVADEVVRRISPQARKTLRFLMTHAPAVSYEDAQAFMKMDGVTMGGVMASFGFAERAGLPRPYVSDRRARLYRVDPATAKTVLEALDRFESK